MQRFYLEKKLQNIEIFENEKFHQLSRVLRVKIGDEMVLFSEESGEYLYEIIEISKKNIQLSQKNRIERDSPENAKNITLFQALPNKIEKIEWILQKNIEIGVQKFVFFKSERSQKLFISESKKQRFLEIAREALEQCGGMKMPEIIFSEKNFEKMIEGHRFDIGIFLHTNGGNNFENIKNSQNIGVFVGPEWWWSESEIQKMNSYSLINAHFWNRILRTETAWMCVAFYLNFY